jgi:YidC/Oxa1 family membrane protein insertase
MSFITVPFSWLLLQLYYLFNNYGVAIIMFAVVVKVILLPFQMKSKRSMMRMSRFTPRLKELEKKYEGNQQKYQEEVAKLYKEEKVNPMSGCLWSLIPFPILIALYSVIRQPLTKIMGLASDQIATLTEKLTAMGLYEAASGSSAYTEITISEVIHQNWDAVCNAVSDFADKLIDIDWSFLGLNLGNKPQWNFFMKVNWSDVSDWLPALGLFLIPFISAFLSWLSMKVSSSGTPQTDEQQNSMKSMTLFMPLMSVYICFVMPAALGIYWIANSALAIIQDVILTRRYNRLLDIEDADRIAREKAREEELEAKRQETERLRAAGETTRNPNTSKRKLQATQKAKDDEREAAVRAAEKAEKRAKMGIPEEQVPDSQVGTRRYARGRAYVADRYGSSDAAPAAPEEQPEAVSEEDSTES